MEDPEPIDAFVGFAWPFEAGVQRHSASSSCLSGPGGEHLDADGRVNAG